MKLYDEHNPIFNVVEGGYYVGIWYLAGRDQDWLAMLYQNPGDTELQFRYRYRYYKDNEIFDETNDEKRIGDVSLGDKTEDEAIAIVDKVVDGLIARGYLGTRLPWAIKKRYTRRIVKGDNRAVWNVMKTLPFAHKKRVTERNP